MNTSTIESIFADIDNKAVQGTIELYKEQYARAGELPLSRRKEERGTIITELDGYIQALEDLGIIRVEDRHIIKHYVRFNEA